MCLLELLEKESTIANCTRILAVHFTLTQPQKRKKRTAMSNLGYIKKFRSQLLRELKRDHTTAFLVLDTIADHAKRKYDEGHPSLDLGEAIITAEECGVTRHQFPTALDYLESIGLIEVMHRGRKDKNSKLLGRNSPPESKRNQKRNQKLIPNGINGTVVKLLDKECYDINFDSGRNQKSEETGIKNQQTPESPYINIGIKKEEIKKNHHPYPSSNAKVVPLTEAMTDDFFYQKNLEHNIDYQNQNHAQELSKTVNVEIIPGVIISQEHLKQCITIKGSLESVKNSIEYIMRHPGRKCKIYNWPEALSKWKIKSNFVPRIQENEQLASKLEVEFGQFTATGWRCYIHHDRKKDVKGLLFEPSSGYLELLFIPFVDPEFKEKASRALRERKMQHARISNG